MLEDNAIDWIRVSKSYSKGTQFALDTITLTIPQSSIFGVFGRNGSGKSTLMKLAAGLIKPSSGSVLINGKRMDESNFHTYIRPAYMPQTALSLNSLKVGEALYWFNDLYGKNKIHKNTLGEICEKLHINSILDKTVRSLSGGQAKLVQFALVLASPSEILILDEPTNELDTYNRKLVWDTIEDTAFNGKTVVVVSHNIAEAQLSITHLCMLHNGQVLAQGKTHDVINDYSDLFSIKIHSREIHSQEVDSTTQLISKEDINAQVQQYFEQGCYEISIGKPSLEDIFLRKTQEQ